MFTAKSAPEVLRRDGGRDHKRMIESGHQTILKTRKETQGFYLVGT